MKQQLLLFLLLFNSLFVMADEEGKCGKNVTWTFTENNHSLIIQGTGDMYNYEETYDWDTQVFGSTAPYFKYSNDIQAVVIGPAITSIGNEAFCWLKNVTTVYISNSVTSIGDGAFEGCENLASIRIPNSVSSIGKYAFEDCENIASVTLSENITQISYGLFQRCKNLTSIVIPNKVKTIESSAFYKCDNLVVVKCLAEQVPTTDADVFEGIDLTYAVLYVPSSAIIAYQYLPPWSDFGTIIPLTEELSVKTIRSEQIPIVECVQGVIKIKGIEDNVMVRIYNMEGQMIGTALSHAGQASIHTKALPLGTLVIVEIGGNRLKIMTK